MVLESQLPQKSSTYCLLLLIKTNVDDFVGELTFWNHLIDALCEIKSILVLVFETWTLDSTGVPRSQENAPPSP